MHYQIFIPGAKRNTKALVTAGLGVIDSGSHEQEIPHGPNNEPGTLYCWTTTKGYVNRDYRPAQQTWTPAVADGEEFPAGRYWVGVENASPPTPSDLIRPYPYVGEKLYLGDGNEWLIPRASAMPFNMIIADDGTTKFIPQQKLSHFLIEAEEWKRFFSEWQPEVSCIYSAMRDFVELGLQANYRIIRDVSSNILNLWTSGESGSVLKAAISICQPGIIAGDNGHG